MGSRYNSRNCINRIFPICAMYALLAICIWKSNIDLIILLPFLALGIVFAVILCLLKQLSTPYSIKIFSCIFASLICCGLYYAFSYIFELYLSKFSFSYSGNQSLAVISEMYHVPALAVSFIAYPILVFITIVITRLLVSGLHDLNLMELFTGFRSQNKIKQICRSVLSITTGIIIAASLCTVLMMAVYSLPSGRITTNLTDSAGLFKEEGARPSLTKWSTSILDNYTDAIILMEAADENDGPVLENALLNYKGTINGTDPVQTLIRHYADGENYDEESPYPRYWHGYNVVLKPALLFFNYSQIRNLNFAVQILLVIMICLLLARRDRSNIIIPFILTYLMLMPPAMGKSLQFSSCFYVTLLSTIALLCLKGEKAYAPLFLFTGVATAFFDLLTFPLMTFGIPAAVLLSLYREKTPEQRIMLTIKNGLCWCAGFAGMWCSKWLIADIFTGSSVIRDAAETILLRTSDSVAEEGIEALSVFSVFGRNILAFAFTPVTIAVIIYMIVYILRLKNHTSLRSSASKLLPYLFVFLIPFLWYTFAANHSLLHFWFTNKALSVAVFSAMCAVSDQYSVCAKESIA